MKPLNRAGKYVEPGNLVLTGNGDKNGNSRETKRKKGKNGGQNEEEKKKKRKKRGESQRMSTTRVKLVMLSRRAWSYLDSTRV